MTIDKTLLKTLRIDLTKALVEVGQQHGIAFDLGTIRFDAKTARCTLNMSTTTRMITGLPGAADESAEDAGGDSPKEAEAMRALANTHIARLCGAEPAWATKVFTLCQTQFKVVGVLPSRWKFPILVKNIRTGKNFVFPAETVRRLLAA